MWTAAKIDDACGSVQPRLHCYTVRQPEQNQTVSVTILSACSDG